MPGHPFSRQGSHGMRQGCRPSRGSMGSTGSSSGIHREQMPQPAGAAPRAAPRRAAPLALLMRRPRLHAAVGRCGSSRHRAAAGRQEGVSEVSGPALAPTPAATLCPSPGRARAAASAVPSTSRCTTRSTPRTTSTGLGRTPGSATATTSPAGSGWTPTPGPSPSSCLMQMVRRGGVGTGGQLCGACLFPLARQCYPAGCGGARRQAACCSCPLPHSRAQLGNCAAPPALALQAASLATPACVAAPASTSPGRASAICAASRCALLHPCPACFILAPPSCTLQHVPCWPGLRGPCPVFNPPPSSATAAAGALPRGHVLLCQPQDSGHSAPAAGEGCW